MKNWDELFQPHILYRGKVYQQEGRVENLTYDHGCYSATVSGAEAYEVTIYTSQKEIIEDMSCTCPYACSGSNCKHMAAVLYAIEEEGVLPVQTDQEAHMSPSELVQSMSEDQIREFLTELARENITIYKEMSLRYGRLSARDQQKILLSEIKEITENYTQYGEIPYKSAYDYGVDISNFISERPMTLWKWGDPKMVLEVAFRALEEYCAQEVDDSHGGTWYVTDAVRSCCKELTAGSTPQQEEEIFSWLRAYRTRKEIHWIIADILDEIIDSSFEGQAFSKKKLEMVKAAVEDASAEASPGETAALLKKEYFLLRKIPEKRQEYEAFCDQYQYCDFFRKARIEALLEESDWEKVIPLIRESRIQDADSRDTVRKYTEILIRIYQETGNTQALKTELHYHIRTFTQYSLEYLLGLKALSAPEEWAGYREEYLARRYEPQRLSLMEHEELWEELMSAMGQEKSIYTLRTYEKSLQTRFPERFCELYIRQLQENAKDCSNRNAYRGLMQDLVHLSDYDNGMTPARQIAGEWRALYYRRSAMMDELKKAGF